MLVGIVHGDKALKDFKLAQSRGWNNLGKVDQDSVLLLLTVLAHHSVVELLL